MAITLEMGEKLSINTQHVEEDIIFDHFFREQYKKMCYVAYTFIDDFALSEDIVQELFSEIWIKKLYLKADFNLKNYLFIAIRNTCFTYLRDKKRTIVINEIPDDLIALENDTTLDELQPLWKAIDELPRQCKIIFKQVVLEDMSYQETATCVGVSLNTVKTQMRIAYKTLREKLDLQQFKLFLCLLKIGINSDLPSNIANL